MPMKGSPAPAVSWGKMLKPAEEGSVGATGWTARKLNRWYPKRASLMALPPKVCEYDTVYCCERLLLCSANPGKVEPVKGSVSVFEFRCTKKYPQRVSLFD